MDMGRNIKEVERNLVEYSIAVVIPCYNVEKQIDALLSSIPPFVHHIIVVNDKSNDKTWPIVQRRRQIDNRIVLLDNPQNLGVGGTVVTGYRKALELGAQIAVKIDGDGQMDPAELPRLIAPLVHGTADFTKGNRFHDFTALRKMPSVRRAGNMALSFLSKAATGYWNCFDPTNGYTAIRCDVLRLLRLEALHPRYFFETSMLGELFLHDAFIMDVAIPARYENEESHLSIAKSLIEYPFRLSALLVRRIFLKRFLYDFDIESMHLVFGVPLLLTGMVYGGYNWWYYLGKGIGAPTGTVVISALLIILGFQLILGAIGADIQKVPRKPLIGTPLPPARQQARSGGRKGWGGGVGRMRSEARRSRRIG